MSNLAYNAVKIENIRLEFLSKGFSEEAIDFVLLQNDNYNFEVLKEKMNSLEQQIINVEKNFQKDISSLDAKIDSVEKNLNNKIDNVKNELNAKIDSVEKNLNNKIDNVKNELNVKIDSVEKNLNNKIDNVKNELTNKIENEVKDLRKDLNMGNRMVHFMILAAAIFGPILHALFMRYLQYIK
ncbi:Bdr family repetitive protein [Borreliella bavariensis]|uniref:Bdr family repetitive protein n=1 Tax=Borreliella bavariensis TaxID=664662 RepID=UPI001BFFFCAB|nr:Bdr family repetitive protein [Borreliella bavariensis]